MIMRTFIPCLLALVSVSWFASPAGAQTCVPSCFEKTFSLAEDVDLDGAVDAGDTVKYTVTLCGEGTCAIGDLLDALNPDADLRLVDDPMRTSTFIYCREDDAGGTTCRPTPRSATVEVCEVSERDDEVNVEVTLLADGCMSFDFFAQVDPMMSGSRDVCNQATEAGGALSDDPETRPTANDPSCFRPEPATPGVVEGAIADLVVADECIGGFPPDGMVNPGERLSLTLAVENVGGTNLEAAPAPPIMGFLEPGPGFTIVSGSSAYTTSVMPDVLLARMGNVGTNTTPFVVDIDPDFLCPGTLDISLRLENLRGGPFIVTYEFRLSDPCEVCDSEAPCILPLSTVSNLLGVKDLSSGPSAARFEWAPESDASDGYRLNTVTVKSEIPDASRSATPVAPSIGLACTSPAAPAPSSCVHATALDPGPPLYYQAVIVCDGDEGPAG